MRPLLILLLLQCIFLAAADPTLPCDLSFIKGVDSSKIHFDDVTKKLTCVGGEQSLMAIEVNSTRYLSLTCDDAEGWKGKKYTKLNETWQGEEYNIAEASAPLNVACVEYCASSGKRIKVKKFSTHDDNDGILLNCAGAHIFYGLADSLEAYCNFNEGWQISAIPDLKNQHVILPKPFVCSKEKNQCNRSLISGVDNSKIHFDETTKTLTCLAGANSLMAIELESKRYASLTCEIHNGWKYGIINSDGETDYYKFAAAYAPLNISCVEYCASTGPGIKVFKNNVYEEVLITCKTGGFRHELFYGETYLQSNAQCKLDKGWMRSGPSRNAKFRNDTSNPAQFECREDQPTTTTITTTPIPITTTTILSTIRTSEEEEKEKVPGANEQSESQTSFILAGFTISGIIFVVIAIAVVFKLSLCKKERPDGGNNSDNTGDSGL